MRRSFLIAFLFLCACAPVAPSDADSETSVVPAEPSPAEEDTSLPEMCDAEDYRYLVGSPISAATLPNAPDLRAFGTDDIVTQEYLPTRTNVLYDQRGTILRVYCG